MAKDEELEATEVTELQILRDHTEFLTTFRYIILAMLSCFGDRSDFAELLIL